VDQGRGYLALSPQGSADPITLSPRISECGVLTLSLLARPPTPLSKRLDRS
jgi:hypothetical protein